MSALVLAHALGTLAMVGVIWFVQLVHYPLLGRVGALDPAAFPTYERENVRRTGWAVIPWMLLEAGSAAALLLTRPADPAPLEVGLGAALLLAVWGVTFAISAPAHGRLEQAWDPAIHARLLGTNWIRTALWSARGALALSWLG